ncbi:NAD(P)-dependent alcohol dehydrogenase [Acidocella sp. KAb 2-4]|uniref:NAD(P)-dependent alcohol dehydrogenase n=1 Tax=Acidocella sp. KAb 2-4 TaxID=2885158 RepID=UPI001D098F42|nr:NAD(P)-dependent alcohol dehydrogenase [Acidocella sp. KAb 2-4]MCB5943417.1 NAD(P)-dependent alcohol dehydrogenase [Acidocella sp. KAb 2-4]
MLVCTGYAAESPSAPLAPYSFTRRAPGQQDVEIEILYCGVCHSDLHFARNEWGFTAYPAVPGHEIVGRVKSVGAGVSKHKVGDLVGVGCMVDSCRTCPSCQEGLEQYCDGGLAGQTYGGVEKQTGEPSKGGYAERIVVDESFVLRIPENLNPAAAAPLLCAGITLYSPLRHWGAGPGRKVGIIGLGGLGHMGVKLARAMGAHTVVFTTSPGKVADARRLGADDVIISKDPEHMAQHAESFDLIIDTVSASHDLAPYFGTLKREATLVQVGAPDKPLPFNVFPLLMKRRNFAGSLIGGIKETQEMLDFCGQHNITADVEMIPIQAINEAYERMLKSDVKYRFCIDMASLKA